MKKIDLEYDEKTGKMFYGGVASEIHSRGFLSSLLQELENTIGPSARGMVYNASKKITVGSVKQYSGALVSVMKLVNKRKLIEALCKQVPQRGYGNIEILEYDEKKPYMLVRVFNSSNAEGMKTEWPVCYDLAGMFAGAAEVVFDREMYCMEKKCIAKGDEFCEFEAYPVK